MASSDIGQAVVPLLIPVVTALVGGAGILIKDARMRRNQQAVRGQAFKDAKAQVEFTTIWVAATQSANPAPEILQAARIQANMWLENAAVRLADTLAAHPQNESHNNLVVRLFLIYRITSRTARILRILFYLSFILLGWFAIGTAAAATSPGQRGQNDLAVGIALLAIFGVLTLLIGYAASHIEFEANYAHQGNDWTLPVFGFNMPPVHPASGDGSHGAPGTPPSGQPPSPVPTAREFAGPPIFTQPTTT